jgi:hypothetical protein
MTVEAPRTDVKKRFETPGSLAIMAIYLVFFFVMWLLGFVYLAAQWAIS